MVAVRPSINPNNRNGSYAGHPHFMESVDGTISAGVVVRVSDMGLTGFIYDRSMDPLDPASYTLEDLSANPTVVAALGLTDPGNGVFGITVEDDHFMVASALDDQDRLWLVGNGHADPQRICFSDPGPDLTTWHTLAWASMPWSASGGNAHTYNHFNRMSDGRLLWFFDQQDSVVNSRGRDINGYYLPLGRTVANIQAGGTNGWRPIIDTATGVGAWTGLAGSQRGEVIYTDNVGNSPAGIGGGPDPGPANRAYISCSFVERRPTGDRLHVSWVYRTADLEAKSSQCQGYGYTDAIGLNTMNAWRNVQGNPLQVPFHWANRIFFEVPVALRTGGTQVLAITPDGRPVFISQNGVQGVGVDPAFGDWIRTEWDGAAWVRTGLGDITQGHPSHPFPVCVDRARRTYTVTSAGSTVRLRTNGGLVGSPLDGVLGGQSPVGQAWPIGGPIDLNNLIAYGTQVAGYQDVMRASIDYVALSREGRLDLLIPDGDDPRIYTFGVHYP